MAFELDVVDVYGLQENERIPIAISMAPFLMSANISFSTIMSALIL